jgi:hypothetical protein
VAAGYTKDYVEHRFPLVLGKDFAGEVDLWISRASWLPCF